MTHINFFKKNIPWWQSLQALPGIQGNVFDLLGASLAINLFSLALPITLMQVYDRILGNASTTTLAWLVFGCCVAIILETILRIARSYTSGWIAAQFDHLVGVSAVERLLSCPLQVLEREGVGVHLERVYAINTLRGFYAGQIFQVLLDLPFALLFIGVIGYLNPTLALVPLVVLGLFFVVVAVFRWQFSFHRVQQGAVNDRRYNFIIEVLSGIHLVKSFGMEEQMLRRYELLQSSAAEANMSVSMWNELPNNVGGFFSQVMMFGIIGLGGPSVMEGTLTVGTLTACTLLGSRAMQPIQTAAGFWLSFSDAALARRQIQLLAEMPQEREVGVHPFPQEINGSITVTDLSFRYREDTPFILDNVSVIFPAKKMIGIHGSSAIGTTTFAYLLMGILKPETGSVDIDGYRLSEWDTSDMRGRVEYLPQYGILFSGSILDNICMFDVSKQAAAMEAASLLGLDEMVANLPQGYKTIITTQSNDTLPTGLIQRIAIARAFVSRPRILIFDKSNAAMDKESEDIFLQFFKRLKGKCTIILISNHPNLLAACDTLYEMQECRLIETKIGFGNLE